MAETTQTAKGKTAKPSPPEAESKGEQPAPDVAELPSIDELEWRCLDCGIRMPPTNRNYMALLRHAKNHSTRLINITTGEVVASNPKETMSKGIELPIGEAAKDDEEDAPVAAPITAGGWQRVTLPPGAFFYYETARELDLVDADVPFERWVYDCIKLRLPLDYGIVLTTAKYEKPRPSSASSGEPT